MTFSCDKCEKVFEREEHLTRHSSRKLPCDRNLACGKCGKNFNLLGNLKQHLNKKIPCEDKRAFLELELKLENARNKGKDTELEIEKEKTKQAQLNQGKVININIQNIFGDQINYINNIDELDDVNPACIYDAEQLTETNNGEKTLGNLIKFIFNNDDYPKNKCIKNHNGELYSKLNDAVVEIKKARFPINNNIKKLIKKIEYDYGPFTEDEIYKYGISQKADHVSYENIDTNKNVDKYIDNPRNNKSVESIIGCSI